MKCRTNYLDNFFIIAYNIIYPIAIIYNYTERQLNMITVFRSIQKFNSQVFGYPSVSPKLPLALRHRTTGTVDRHMHDT